MGSFRKRGLPDSQELQCNSEQRQADTQELLINEGRSDRERELPDFVESQSFLDKDEKTKLISSAKQKKANAVSYFNRLKLDGVYRHKFALSMILSWSSLCLGWLSGLFGPSFLDLRIITKTRLDKATFFMTAHTTGYLTGSLVGGILFDTFNKILLEFLTVLANVFTSVAIPWCSQFWSMITVLALRGIFIGGQNVAANALLVSIWSNDQDGQSFMQGLHFAYSIGGIISPLVTSHFLAEEVPQMSSLAPTNLSNATGYQFYDLNSSANMSNALQEHSLLYIPYSMTGGLYLTSAISIFVFYLITKDGRTTENKKSEQQSSYKHRIPKSLKILVLVHICSLFAIYCAIEDSFINLLATFCVTQMQWTKVNSAFVTSVLWASFSTGRFSGIFLASRFKPSTLILFCSNSLSLSLMGFYLSAKLRFHVGIWLFTTTTGFGLSVIFPCIFSWTESNLMAISGKMTSIFLIAGSFSMLNPLALGVLMEMITPMWFTYLLLIQSVFFVLVFISLLLISRALVIRYGPIYTSTNDDDVMITDNGEILERCK